MPWVLIRWENLDEKHDVWVPKSNLSLDSAKE